MPKSPGSLTPASFLKKPPDPTSLKKNRGNKRKLSTSPTLPPVSKPRISTTPPDKTGSNSPTSPAISPLLPYQLRPKKSSSISKSIKFSLSSSLLSHSMDNILESGHDDIMMELPSADEVDALLHEDSTESKEDDADAGSFSPLSNADSPTAAVKAAIEAKMNENLITLDTSSKAAIDANKNDSKNDSNQAVPLPSLPPPLSKPRPLFPSPDPSFQMASPPLLNQPPAPLREALLERVKTKPQATIPLNKPTLQRPAPPVTRKLSKIFCTSTLLNLLKIRSRMMSGRQLMLIFSMLSQTRTWMTHSQSGLPALAMMHPTNVGTLRVVTLPVKTGVKLCLG